MAELLRQYFRIAFLMGRPQELPGGAAQLQVGLSLAFVTYMVALLGVYDFWSALSIALLDLGCTALSLRVALSLVDHPGRFEQAFGGLCGASAVVNAAAVPIYLSRPPAGTLEEGPALAEFVLLVWSISLLAHVLRHTFEVRMGISIGIAFLYVLVLTTLVDAMLPSSDREAAPSGYLDDESAARSSDDPAVAGGESLRGVVLLS